MEVKARGADVAGPHHTQAMPGGAGQERADSRHLRSRTTHPMLLPSLERGAPAAVRLLCGALMRGCDIDKPRNLAKSVTVE